jgi:hypothetical protein
MLHFLLRANHFIILLKRDFGDDPSAFSKIYSFQFGDKTIEYDAEREFEVKGW